MSFEAADKSLAGRLIEVSDGASEVGRATARLLAAAGARVVLSYTGDPEPTRAAAERLRAEGLDVTCAAHDQPEVGRPELLVATAAPASGSAPDPASEHDVVVVGMGLAVPGASSPEQFWQLLRSGEPMFSEPGARLDLSHLWSADPGAQDRTYTRTAGFLCDFVPHPALAAELASGAFEAQEYTAIWLRHALLQATDGIARNSADRALFAVGLTPDGSQHLEQSLVTSAVSQLLTKAGHPVPVGLAQRYPLGAADPEDVLPYQIARAAVAGLLDEPEIVVVDTACSSSLYSIDIGVRALRAGDVDIALCGGAFALTAQNLVLFAKLQGLSRSGNVRSLDAGADGVLFSDSAAVLALKTHARAVADGDPILGFVAGFGGSSDGRGKAIYAPNAAGQKIALQRAWSAAGTGPDGPDWVVAHATGTPAGDRTEMVALAEAAPGKSWRMTSSKSLIGHSGWAAGVVSVIHALLAMRYETIPGQRVFRELPAAAPPAIEVPTADCGWPAGPGRTRQVGVSAMGFGGTNGHMILTDRAPQRAGRPSPDSAGEEVVVVSTGWHLPGNPGAQQLADWLAGGQPSWPESFGADYPLPSPVELRLAPSAIAAMDRSQLIALKCVDQLSGDWRTDPELSARAGVLVGHTGPTRSAFGYDLRCLLTDLSETVLKPAGIPPEVIAEPVHAMVRPTNEDSYPGLMPNIIPARVVQRLDLHGLNMTLDAGRDSVNSALANAVRYLRDGELDVALVLGVNASVDFLRPWRGRRPAEAAIGFVLTTASIADRLQLPVLGRLAVEPAGGVGDAPATVPSPPGDRDHRGAEGAVSLLAALRGQAGQPVRIASVEDGCTPAILVTPGPITVEKRVASVPASGLTADETATASGTAELARDFSRHQVVLRPRATGRSDTRPLAALVPNSLLIIDEPRALAGVVLPPGCLVIAPRPAAQLPPAEQVRYLDDAGKLADVLAADGRPFDQIRVVLSTGWSAAALKVHDLTFAAAQTCADALAGGGCLAVLLLDSVVSTAGSPVPVPLAGLFGGLARSLSRELPAARVLVTVTDTATAADGLVQLGAELAGSRLLPVAYYAGGRRYEQLLVPVPPAEPSTDPRLPVDAVMLATGGARGLTAHLVAELATGSRPNSIWLLGSSPEPSGAVQDKLPSKPEMVRRLMAEHPSEKLAEITRRYERAVQDAERAKTMAALRQLTGPGGVHYLQCDVRDGAAVAEAVRTVLDRHGRIDIVVHGAGLSRSASLDRKRLSDFRIVRDVKVLGDLNLRAALEAGGQRPALWCSVSSVSAIIGMRGEFDYCAGNEYLMLAAAYARAVQGRDEVALTSGLWLESGMASADTPGGAFLARQAEIGQLSDVQGRQFFRAELLGRPGPGAGGPVATTWLGALDWASLHAGAAGLREAGLREAGLHEAGQPEAAASTPQWAFLDPAARTGSDPARWSCAIDLDRHRYLRDHLVEDRPALPGTFILELGMEAAAALAPPGQQPVAITDVVLSRFIRAAEHRWPRTVLVSAELAGDAVLVRVSSPASELVPEREHTRMTVRLAGSLPPAPFADPVAGDGWPAPNTYQQSGTPVRLAGIFDALHEPRFERDGGSARLRLAVTDLDGPFEHFRLPSLTLDCLLRTAVLDGSRPERVAAMVPTELASIQLFSTANDLELAARWPGGLLLRHWRHEASGLSRCAAIAPDGQVLLLVEGIKGSEQAIFDVRAGAWLSPTAGGTHRQAPVTAGSA